MPQTPDPREPADTPFARWLWNFMQARKLTQGKIHAITGIAASTIGDWLYHGVIPKPATQALFAAKMRIPLQVVRDACDGHLSAQAQAEMDEAVRRVHEEAARLIQMNVDFLRRYGPPPSES